MTKYIYINNRQYETGKLFSAQPQHLRIARMNRAVRVVEQTGTYHG